MNTPHQTPGRQRGIILPLLAVGMVVIVGMVGLALDMGHAYLSKTRLQNALDAAALSSAKTLDETNDTVLATTAAITTFNSNAALDMDNPAVTLVVQFSPTLIPFVSGAANPLYVRVRVASYQQEMWFAQVLPGTGTEKIVGATAVAGPSPVLGVICDIAPIMVCGDPAADDDCDDGSCYGYTYDPDSTTETILKSGAGEHGEVGPGNYQLVNLADSKGGNDIRYNLAGSFEQCFNTDNDINTATGNNVGPVAQGLNTRFGMYNGPFSPEDRDIYKPDLVSDLHSTDGYYFSDYLGAYASSSFDNPDGEAERRVVSVPIGDCSGTTNGTGTVPLLGLGCFFLTRPAEQNGEQRIYGQFVEGCGAHGIPGPDPVSGPGPHIIVLYKDPDNVDS
jgi:Flp pilus assembly protein TadG